MSESEVHVINVKSIENDNLFLERVSILLFIFYKNNFNLNIFREKINCALNVLYSDYFIK